MYGRAMRPINIEIWNDVDGSARIRVKAGNGKIILDSEAYEGGVSRANHAVDVVVDHIQSGNFRVTHLSG